MCSTRAKLNRRNFIPGPHGALHFLPRSGQSNRLTPHLGPLPIEGRGGAAGVKGLTSAIAASRAVNSTREFYRARPGIDALQSACRATPSPLNGESAGVRGEYAPGCPDFQLCTACILHEMRSCRFLETKMFHNICLP